VNWSLPAGTLITCPRCKAEIARTTKEMRPGVTLEAALFAWIGTPIRDGEYMDCRKCGEGWTTTKGYRDEDGVVTVFQIHTAEGWLPPMPGAKRISKIDGRHVP